MIENESASQQKNLKGELRFTFFSDITGTSRSFADQLSNAKQYHAFIKSFDPNA